MPEESLTIKTTKMLTKLSNNNLVQSFAFPAPANIEKQQARLEEDQKIALAARLNGFLADSYLLMLKTHAYHWNVKGRKTREFQHLSEENYTFLFDSVDIVADRISELGFEVMGTFREFVQNSGITEARKGLSREKMSRDLLQSHEEMVLMLNEILEYSHEIGDEVTKDLLIVIQASHERAIWSLSRHLAGEEV